MLFNSIDFAIFLPIVFILYWGIFYRSLKLQNLTIVIASYIFYGWWDWRFLSLIAFSTIVDYQVGIYLSRESVLFKRKLLLWTSLIVNLGLLGFFKYYNFFLDNFVSAFTFMGVEIKANQLNIILPVGISFYTFQTLSYTIDVYRKKIQPTKSLLVFSSFVSFFPQLVAGPIERASNLLPQFYTSRVFNQSLAIDGLRQILWGLFKKVVIADQCAEHVNIIFNNSGDYSGSTLLLGAVLFAFQIYGDFSGYSDIAIGTAKLFGINLMRNFAYPYFSRDIAEFWRRWHISLSTWFKDYVYIPLGGSKGSRLFNIRNIFIVFIVSGFWHGANWTYIVWGCLNALYFLPLFLLNKHKNNTGIVAEGKKLPSIGEIYSMFSTFMLTVFAWIFFRAENLPHAIEYISTIFSHSIFTIPERRPKELVLFISLLILFEWFGRGKPHPLADISNNILVRWGCYLFLTLIVIVFSASDDYQFIYFQF